MHLSRQLRKNLFFLHWMSCTRPAMCPSVPTLKVFLAMQGSLLMKGNCWMCTVKAVLLFRERFGWTKTFLVLVHPNQRCFWGTKNSARSFANFSFKAGQQMTMNYIATFQEVSKTWTGSSNVVTEVWPTKVLHKSISWLCILSWLF